MDIVIDPALQAYIDPLTPEEHEALERSLLAEGCRDALVLWGQVLVDGHNRYGLCTKHGLPFRTVQNPRFQSMDDVHLWMIDQHLGRRSVSNFQRGLLALRKREILEARRAQAMASDVPAAHAAATNAGHGANDTAPWDDAGSTAGAPLTGGEAASATGATTSATTSAPPSPQAAQDAAALSTREDLARLARLSSAQVQMIEKIQKQAAPEVVAAVRAGALSINAAAAVASLPAEEQAAAAAAGPEELKQAARRAREARRKPKAEADAGSVPASGAADDPSATPAGADGTDTSVDALQAQLRTLRADNAALRQQVIALEAELAALRAA